MIMCVPLGLILTGKPKATVPVTALSFGVKIDPSWDQEVPVRLNTQTAPKDEN